MRFLPSQRVERREHGHRGAQAAHGNLLVAAGVIKSGGIERQQSVDGFAILDSRRPVVFVMIQIRGRQQQHAFRRMRKHPPHRFAHPHERLEFDRSQRHGHKRKSRRQHLKKRHLHLKRMLRAVRHAVLAEQRAFSPQFLGKRFVDRRIPERRAPGPAR